MSFLKKAILNLTEAFVGELEELEQQEKNEEWETIGPRLLSQYRLFLKLLATTINTAEPEGETRNVT